MEPDNGVKAAHALHHLIAVFIKDDLIVFYLEGLADIEWGMVKMEFPTVTFIPSTMARGKRNLHGHCGAGSVLAGNGDSAAHGFHIFLTTSMPTPRPEYSVTAWLVEKPGTIIRLKAS